MPRKQKKYHFIYKTTNKLNGKYYIGMHSTNNIDDGYLGSGKRLRYSIRKYGEENFEREILEFFDSREELKKREEEVVNLEEIAKKDCMNMIVGGEGGRGFTSEEARKGREVTNKKHGHKLSEWGKKGQKSMYEKYGSVFKDSEKRCDWNGRKHSNESKEKMSKSSKGLGKGEKNSQFGTCWITNGVENKKIKKEELDIFVQQGWKKGRKMKI